MKNKISFYLISFTILFLGIKSTVFAAQEAELKNAPWFETKENILLKGNISEDISTIKPQTGIGVIGLRFIHHTGYPSFVEQVYPNSPASKGGIKKRDLIFSIDGVRTDHLTSDAVFELLSGKPGSKVVIQIRRGEASFNLDLIREDLANLSQDVQNRYLSGPISVPFNPKDFFPYH